MKLPFQISFPNTTVLDSLIKSQKEAPFTYHKNNLKGYRFDENRILLGHGESAFEAAKKAIATWQMFPGTWACIYKETTPIEVGQIVVMLARVTGLWWLNTAKIVYTVKESNAFGFAYGTLTHHAESGEELFQVNIDDDGAVWYTIKAFSKPRHILARLAFPIARYYQKKFVKQSLKKMQDYVRKQIAYTHTAVSH
jgi:uncharacterized protein (UPF0548 family)